jgi:hypothetical protein
LDFAEISRLGFYGVLARFEGFSTGFLFFFIGFLMH